MVRPIEYIRWHVAHADGRHDLATSDQHAVAGEWHVAPEVLADRPDPPADVTLAEQLASRYDVPRDHLVVTAGATQANLAVAAAAMGDDPDPRVLVETPGYEPLRATPDWLGATIDRFRRPAEDGFDLDPERLGNAVGDRTALAVVTNRHNPGGRRVDRDRLATGAEAAGETRLLVDEVYAPFGHDATDGPFGGPTAAGLEGTAVTGSLTKFLGLGGLRVGWVVAEPSFLEAVRDVLYHLPRPGEPGIALARRALHNLDHVADRAREQGRENHSLLASFLADRPSLSGPVFEGATYAALAHETADGDTVAAAAAERDCTVVPGRFFEVPDRFRVSLGGSPDEMAAALSVLGEALDHLA